MIGKSLLHYEVLELLGAGGMGQVYKARDSRLRRQVALKVLSPDRPITEDRRRRFLREARAASALNHPGIVTVHDIDRDDGVDFIVMEYVDGSSLSTKVVEGGLPWREAASIALEIGEAMVAAHEAGLVHRDLKPLNVMIASKGRVKLLDFGIAKLDPTVDTADTHETLTRLETEAGQTPGTLAYMSPEQFLGEPIDARSDIFSFGVVLYEMLTGSRPFLSQDEMDGEQRTFLYQLLYGEAPRIRDSHPEVPERLAGLVGRCLQRQRNARPQTMDRVVEELRQILEGRPGAELSAIHPPGDDSRAEGSYADRPEDNSFDVATANQTVGAEETDVAFSGPPPIPTLESKRAQTKGFVRSKARLFARFIFAMVVLNGVIWWMNSRDRSRLDQIVHSAPAVALDVLDDQTSKPDADRAELLALLRQRAEPTDVLSHTPAGLSGDAAARWLLRFVELVLPWVEQTPDDAVLVASLIQRLDFLEVQDPQVLVQALELRSRLIEPLRRQRPPPNASRDAIRPDWMKVPGGDLDQTAVAGFRLLGRPVTAGEYRRLWPDSHPGTPDDAPARAADWAQAYVYTVWLGGRLPTAQELRYAAQTCSPYGACQADGWRSSWSLDEMLGDSPEWVSGPAEVGPSVIRSGGDSSDSGAKGVEEATATAGFRIVIPESNLPPKITLTEPPAGATLPSGSNVRIEADALDLDGSILRVDFFAYNRGSLQPLGADSTEPYGMLWKNVTDGYYVVHAEAIDNGGRKSSAKAEIRIGVPRLPYHEDPVTIPGKIEAEDFDLGAHGAAYFDNSPGNFGRQYRTDTDVDIQDTGDLGGGFNVGWAGSGEWLEYTIDVAQAGDYDLHVRVASNNDGGMFNVEFDGDDKTGMMSVPVTGGWQDWQTLSARIELDAGVQVMRWRNSPSSTEYNLNYFWLVEAGSSLCGDGICQPGEDCSSCSQDCPSVTEGWPVNRHCCGNGVTEPPEEDGSICGGNN